MSRNDKATPIRVALIGAAGAIIAALIAAGVFNKASKQEIRGRVVEEDTRTPIPYAHVTLVGRNENYTADDLGNFKIQLQGSTDSSEVRVTISKQGYITADRGITPPQTNWVIELKKGPTELTPAGGPGQGASIAPATLSVCVGFEPWLGYERAEVSAINDGYTLAFRVQNDSDNEVAVSTIRTNTLHDNQHNELILRDSSLPDVLCNPPEACAAETYRNGLKVEPHTRGSISYRFLGLGDRKHGSLVSTETTVVFTRKGDDGKFITARKLINCDDVPVR
jgi:hypothetical protein